MRRAFLVVSLLVSSAILACSSASSSGVATSSSGASGGASAGEGGSSASVGSTSGSGGGGASGASGTTSSLAGTAGASGATSSAGGSAGSSANGGNAGATTNGGSGGASTAGGGGSDGGSMSNAGSAGAMTALTPIDWADAWVMGFYGDAANQGVNRYDHVDAMGAPDGFYTTWKGDQGASLFANVTDCSSFSDVLMQKSYGWTPPTTNARPLAADYYWAIRNGVRFQVIDKADDIARGDVIALLYGESDSGGDTGHVAWIDSPPVDFDGAPEEPGLTQAGVVIVDSSHGFHYAPSSANGQDDRYLGKLANGSDCSTDDECASQFGTSSAVCNSWTLSSASVCSFTGVGSGRMRLYLDADGSIAGYAWSTNAGTTFYPRPNPLPSQGGSFTGRDIVVGRYVGG